MKQQVSLCRLLLRLSALLLAALVQGIAPIRSPGVLAKTNNVQLSLPDSVSWGFSALSVRGGSDEEEEEEEDEEDEEEEDGVALVDQILDISKRGMVLAGKAVLETYKVLQRAIQAGFQGEADQEVDEDDQEVDEDDQPPTVVTEVLDEKEDEEEEEEDGVTLADEILDISKRGMVLAGKAVLETYKALQRAILAGFQGEDDQEVDEDDQPPDVVTKVLNTLKRMIKAAFARPQEESEDEDAAAVKSVIKASKKLKKKTVEESEDEESEELASSSSSPPADFGTYLSKAYGVTDERDESGPTILGGTLSDALKVARSQARLLVVLIPSAQPKKVKSDKEAIESVLSLEVAQAANKRARKNGEETGSFLFWGAKTGSSEATAAIKRLKTKATSSKGEKRPVLSVVYPAQTIGSNGVLKITAKVLAQHHCSPPPASSLMVKWLNALRKRHAKQYNAMQTEMKEIQYFKERKVGYRDSVDNDIQRIEREAKEEAERMVKAKAEIERMAAIQKRREELKSSLPPEDKSDKAKTVALRFADGKSGQRKFAPDTPLSTVFDWVDAMFEIERETVVLTTLNGKQTFSWDDADSKKETLEQAGLGRMIGLRVTENKPEASEKEKEEPKGEDSQ